MSENICGFTYKVIFLDTDEYVLSNEMVDIEVPESEDREADRDLASEKADEWAASNCDVYGADDYETELQNAY